MEVMPESYSAENTSRMASIISSKLREYGLELRKMVANKKPAAAIKARKTEMLGDIYHILTLALGEPVKTFEYALRIRMAIALANQRPTHHKRSATKW